jgi:tetratricopeptide (TPR) repeat protein
MKQLKLFLQNFAGAAALVLALLGSIKSFIDLEFSMANMAAASVIIIAFCLCVTGYKKKHKFFFSPVQRVLAVAGIAMMIVAWYVYLFYCESQQPAYQVTIHKFSEGSGGKDPFQNKLFDVLNSKSLPPEFAQFKDGHFYIDTKSDISDREKQIAKGIKRTCNYRGFIVYGNVDDEHNAYSFYIQNRGAYGNTSSIFIENKEIIITNPPVLSLKENYTKETEKLADFIIGLLYYSNGDYEKAIDKLRASSPSDSSELRFYSFLFMGYCSLHSAPQTALNYLDSARAIDRGDKSKSFHLDEIIQVVKQGISDKRIRLKKEADNSIRDLKKSYDLFLNDKMTDEKLMSELSITLEHIDKESEYSENIQFTKAINRLKEEKEISYKEIYAMRKMPFVSSLNPIGISKDELIKIDLCLAYRLYKENNFFWRVYISDAFDLLGT